MIRVIAAVVGLSVFPLIFARGHRPTPNPQAQTPETQTIPAQEILPPGTVDGSKTPWLIPDSVAYSLFFETVAEPPEPSDLEVRRQRARLLPAQLNDADYQKVVFALATFRSQLAVLESKYANSSDADGYRIDRDALLTNTIEGLRVGLSLKGMAGLDALIQSEKRNMKIAPLAANAN